MKLLAFNGTDLHSNRIRTTILRDTFGRKWCVLDSRRYGILYGAKSAWDFQISDLVKNPDGTYI